MKPLQVLFVIDSLTTGGAERSLAEMMPYLERAGIEASIACFYRTGQGVENDLFANEKVHLVTAKHRVGRVREIRRLIQTQKPDVVHTTLFEADVIGRLACVGTSAVSLTSLVNTSYVEARFRDPHIRRSRLLAVRSIEGWTARHLTNHFHAISNAVKAHAVDAMRIPSERITVIERGRDPNRLGRPSLERKLDARSTLGLHAADEVIVTVGRQEYQKGQRFLIEAAASMAERHPRIVVLIAGREGAESTALRDAHSQTGLGNRLRFLGHREDLADVLAAADIFVFPSLYEGLGGALIEAMALGLPIIASDLPAIREVVEDGVNGRLVPPGSSPEIACALEAMLGSPDSRTRLGQSGRRIFEERFTLERSASRMVALYQQLRFSVRTTLRRRLHPSPQEPKDRSATEEASTGYGNI